jgi:hypothetical protein
MALGVNSGEQLGSVVNVVEVPVADEQTIEDAPARLAMPSTSAVVRKSDRLNTAVFSL